MFIYLATSDFYRILHIAKLGMTEDLYGRRSTYQTSCPPGIVPDSHDIDYDVVWETDASSRDELFDYEDIVHNQFIRWRMMRSKPGDSEWFDFKEHSPLEIVKDFMKNMTWVKREVPLTEIAPLKRPSRHLRKQHAKNINFIRTKSKRNEALDQIQKPVIQAILQFILSSVLFAGYVIAPCGSGKTLMTCRGITGQNRVIICCPSNQIQRQWASTLISEGAFTKKQILTMGSSNNGTTNPDAIRSFMQQDTYCVITTYMSSNILVDILTNDTQILVLDEAHHLGGIVGKENEGEGKTRRLMMKATELQVKRLSLTFTPRIVRNDDNLDIEYASMDDTHIFGSRIAELKFRELIRKGILPDYRIWSLRDSSKKGTGILGKADSILESWEATEIVRDVEQHILRHLIVFASTNDEATQLERYFTNNTKDTLVLCVKGGDELEEPIRRFSEAKRAIIVNCRVLGEGIDIPVANAVAVTYPKHSVGDITQTLLRPGRWCEGKPVFHILLPVFDEDDMSGFEDVLTALASCDDKLRDEVILRATNPVGDKKKPPTTAGHAGDVAECIMIDDYDGSNIEEIRKCFVNIRRNLFPSRVSNCIQELCIDKGVDTSIEYNMILRAEMPELPEDPKPKKSTWYDYLHPKFENKIAVQDFVTDILESNNLHVGHKYDEWHGVQPSDVRTKLPSVQHINDGYFGVDYTNFNGLLEKFGKKKVNNRR
jgi:superfamily II DNA or RNA helicase